MAANWRLWYRSIAQTKPTILLRPWPFIRPFSSAMDSRITPTERVTCVGENLWVEFTALAAKAKVNLGQGFPNYSPPDVLLDSLREATEKPLMHQYTRGQGHPRAVKALADIYGRVMGREINPNSEVIVTVGAYSSLYFIIQAFVHPGDEVIVIEPFFDCYAPMTTMAGAKTVGVPLRPQGKFPGSSKDYTIDPNELASAITDKTKAIIINNPNNPLGKVYSQGELEMVADLCKKRDLLCISDEVYEWLTHDGLRHFKIATLPDMWERTITIGSAGKTFNATGWKLGWTIAPEKYIKYMMKVAANSCYTMSTVLQEAVGSALQKELPKLGTSDSFFKTMQEQFQVKRDEMVAVLKETGLDPIVPEGGYFIVVDMSRLGLTFDASNEYYDYQLVKWLAGEKGLSLIPTSAFYTSEHKDISGQTVRFCCCKTDDVLQECYKILRTWAAERSQKSK